MQIRHLFAAIILCKAANANAETQSLSVKDVQAHGVSSYQATKASAETDGHIYGQIRIEGMQYFTELPEQSQLTNSQLLSARLSGLKETSWLDFAADISGGTFFSLGQTHFVVHEAYTGTHGSSRLKAFLGRKKNEWSDLDRRWQLGMWQPYFAIDALRPEDQGLAGLFVNYKAPQFEMLLFATPVFIPNMGPDIREEGGGLVSDSRWYRAPSRNYDFNNRINTIQYSLDIPQTEKLVLNGAVGMLLRAGNKQSGPWAVASAGYLPVNELILKRQNFKVISADQVDVTVTPDVAYHELYSMDVGYSFSNLKASVSYLRDQPKEKLPEPDWAIQSLQPLQAYAAAMVFSLDNVFTKTLAFRLDYLKVVGGGIVDILADGGADDFTLFDQRVKFTHALSFGVEGQLASFFKRPFVTRLKYLYDYDQRGSLLNTEFLYYPNQKWAVVLGADVLGVQKEDFNPSGFINQYRANDRFYGGMTYVF